MADGRIVAKHVRVQIDLSRGEMEALISMLNQYKKEIADRLPSGSIVEYENSHLIQTLNEIYNQNIHTEIIEED